MKSTKKIFAMVIAVVMILALVVPAMAAGPYTLTLNGAQGGHTYTAYQIFAGDLNGSTLSNIVWGSGVTEDGKTALGDAAEKAKELTTQAEAEAFAAAVAPYLGTAAGSVTIAAGATTGTISGLEAGYYLIQTTDTATENGVKTYYIMKVVKDTTATIKADVPEVEKTVDDNDVSIGDTVTFTLTATMPSTLEGYGEYKIVFTDTMSKGLTYNNDATVNVEGFTVTHATDGEGNTILTISNDNVLDNGVKAGDTITVTYTATLNSKAVIAGAGNPNTVYLEYSNDPNGDGTATGKTPEEDVKVYTYDMEVLKYADGDESNKLEGVKFILLNAEKTKIAKVADGKLVSWDAFTEGMDVTAYKMATGADGKISVDGLASGTYYLRETDALPGYNKLTGDTTVTVDNLTDGVYVTFVAKINNQSGATLPETGGMGTVLFISFGAILTIGAAVLLISKKRAADMM